MDLFLLSDVVFVTTVEGNFGLAVFVTNTSTTAALVCCEKKKRVSTNTERYLVQF